MNLNTFILLLAVLAISEAYEYENKENDVVEARGKAKYALLTNLAILLAAKVGLYKIALGIALIIGAMKFLVVLAWALAIFKYVPDPYIYYNSVDYQKSQFHFDPYNHHRNGHVQAHYDPWNNHDNYGPWRYHDKDGYGSSIHFFYVVATKLFVLKLVYGAIFYALIVKGWHFVSWFIHYLKEKKSHDHHEYVELDHEPYHGHDHHHYSHDHNGHDHYGHDSYGPYAYDKYGSASDIVYKKPGVKKSMYDADGSYSVKS